jgi:hypothetical protein
VRADALGNAVPLTPLPKRWLLETEGVHQLEREFLSSLDMALDSGSFRGGTSELSILESSLRSLAIFGPKYIAEI